MTGFHPDWLALREPHDHVARDGRLVITLNGWLAARTEAGSAVAVTDLGCGAGSNLRYLAPRLPSPQRWRLVDNDAALLGALSNGDGFDAGIHQTLLHDLTDLEGLSFDECDVVVASALMDLASPEWFGRLAEKCSRCGTALLVALDYDGRMEWQPMLSDDAWIEGRFNVHQRGDKGFGPAMGPTSTETMSAIMTELGYTVTTVQTPWELGHDDGVIQGELVEGIAAACLEISPREADRIKSWSTQRGEINDAGGSSLLVGHCDLLALPPEPHL